MKFIIVRYRKTVHKNVYKIYSKCKLAVIIANYLNVEWNYYQERT